MTDDRFVREIVEAETPEQIDLLREIALADGIEVERPVTPEALEPVSALILFGGAALVAGAIAHWREVLTGGQVIDLRQGATEVAYRTRNVQYGLVLILLANGEVKVEVKEPRGYFGQVAKDVFDALQGLAEKTVDAAIKAAEAAVGDRAKVAQAE